jgi:hypothetical protein
MGLTGTVAARTLAPQVSAMARAVMVNELDKDGVFISFLMTREGTKMLLLTPILSLVKKKA